MRAKIDKVAETWERRFLDQVDIELEKDFDALVAAMKGTTKADPWEKVDWQVVQDKWQQVYADRENDWRNAFVPLIKGVITSQSKWMNTAFGMTFDVQNLFGLKWFDDYTLKFAQPIQETNSRELSVMLQEAMLTGASIPEMEEGMRKLWDVWMDFADPADIDQIALWTADRTPRARRELIARTETIRASNAGLQHLYEGWGTPMKVWMATNDNRTRPSHIVAGEWYAEGGTIGPIPVTETFTVGEAQMMYPGDPSGPIEEFANCRCSVLPYNPAWDMSEDELAEALSAAEAESQIAKPGAQGIDPGVVTSPELEGKKPVTFRKPDSQYDAVGRDVTQQRGLVLNGIPLKHADPDQWHAIPDVNVGEPALPALNGLRQSAGIMIVEPDGRVWIYEPANHYGGVNHTFPKGGVEPGLTTQQAALKEVYEELGIKAEILGYLADGKGTTSMTRYYVGRRIAGQPWDSSWEADNVKLMTQADARKLVGVGRDRLLLTDLKNYIKKNGLPPLPRGGFDAALNTVESLIVDILGPDAIAPEPEPKPEVGWPAYASLRQVRGLGGSTGAYLMEDPVTGKLYVSKGGNSPAHIESEYRTNLAYRAMGVNVPGVQLYTMPDGTKRQVMEYIEGTPLGQVRDKRAIKDLQKGFATDAMLGNWDVIGASGDNVIVDKDGVAWRVDNGGGLFYRAQGATKGQSFGDEPVALWTMRDKKVNEQAAKYFGDLKWTTIKGQLGKLTTKKQLDALKGILSPDEYKVVEARNKEMRRVFTLTKTLRDDSFKYDYIDAFCRESVGLRAAGITARFPKSLKRKLTDLSVTDETGKRFDHMRGTNSIISDLSSYMSNNGGEYNIVASWAEAQGMGSWSEGAQAVKYLNATGMRDIPTSKYYWQKGIDEAKKCFSFYFGTRDKEERARRTFTQWHAFNYEFLQATKFDHNIQGRNYVELVRTEARSVLDKAGIREDDKDKIMMRGVAESSSIFKTVNVGGASMTLQQVPHHRVFAAYFFENSPGSGHTLFYGDKENEFVFLPEGIPLSRHGQSGGGENTDKWWDWYKRK